LSTVPGSEDGFKGLLAQQWDAIFLYDDWVTIAVPEMIGAYPSYYGEILKSGEYPGYVIETLWVDGESYAMRMTPSAHSAVLIGPVIFPDALCADSACCGQQDVQRSIRTSLRCSVFP